MIEILPEIYFPLFDYRLPELRETDPRTMQLRKLVFNLTKVGPSFDVDGIYKYSCLSCVCHTGNYWYTSSFDITYAKQRQIPDIIYKEIVDHVDNHVHFGKWARSFYK